jgi:hypothetical protein
MEKATRETDPCAHLVLVLLAGAAPRAGRTGDGGVRGGGAPMCKREESSVVVVRGGPGSGRPLFIGGNKAVWAAGFSSSRSFYGRQWRFEKYPGVDSGRRNSQSMKRCGIGPVVQASWPWPRRGGGDAVRWCWRGWLGQSL